MHRHRCRHAFTLIELLVVIAVIGVLVAITLPAVQQARERARATVCLNNLKQLGLALANYESAHGLFPPSFIRQEDGNPPPPPVQFAALRYRSHWTGFHMLLPYLEQFSLYNEYDFTGTWLTSLQDPLDRQSWPLNQTAIPTLLCPSAPHAGTSIGGLPGGVQSSVAGPHWMAGAPTDYSFSHGADIIRALPGLDAGCPGGVLHYWTQWPNATRGAFGYSSDCKTRDIVDGLSQTFVMGEKAGGLLTFGGSDPSFPTLLVEYPWAMAAVMYFAPTGGSSIPGSYWVAGPFAATRDIKLPDCPDAPRERGVPFPMNPQPRIIPPTFDERPLYSFQSAHPQGAHFLFADGQARFLKEAIDQFAYESLSTIAASELISSGDF